MAIIGTNDTATVRVANLPSGAVFGNAASVAVTPTGGVSSTNVQAAIAELDAEKAPLASPNFTGSIQLAAIMQPRTVALTINDDAVGSIDLTSYRRGGFATIVALTEATGLFPVRVDSCEIWFDVGSSLECFRTSNAAVVGSNVDAVTTDVTGTSGTDGKVTVAAQTNTLKIENRSGNTRYFVVTIV